MTKKDFQFIARVIGELPVRNDLPSALHTAHKDMIADRFADALYDVNERFDRKRFLDAVRRESHNNH